MHAPKLGELTHTHNNRLAQVKLPHLYRVTWSDHNAIRIYRF